VLGSLSSSTALAAAPPPRPAPPPQSSLLGPLPLGSSGGGRGRGGGRGVGRGGNTAPPSPQGAPWPSFHNPWSRRISMWPFQAPGGEPLPPAAMLTGASPGFPSATPWAAPPASTWPGPAGWDQATLANSFSTTSDHKGYRCYDLTSHRVLVSRHVVFDEPVFPFSTTTPPASTSDDLSSVVPTDPVVEPPLPVFPAGTTSCPSSPVARDTPRPVPCPGLEGSAFGPVPAHDTGPESATPTPAPLARFA